MVGDLVGRRVDVYRNLTDDCWSVKLMEPDADEYGQVIAHVDRIRISDPSFVVQQAGLDRMRRTETRNVHAFVRGVCDRFGPNARIGPRKAIEIEYRPLSSIWGDSDCPFVYVRTSSSVHVDAYPDPEYVLCTEDGAFGLFPF